MFEPICQRVITGDYASSPARLYGYRRTCVVGESYPAIYEDEADSYVKGVVYFDMSKHDLSLLDDFEGEYYEQKTVALELPDGSSLHARAYVLKDAFCHMASVRDWDADAFASTGIRRFLKRYGGAAKPRERR